MRYQNGAPVQMYVGVDQETGDIVCAATNRKSAKTAAAEIGDTVKVFTYVLKEAQ